MGGQLDQQLGRHVVLHPEPHGTASAALRGERPETLLHQLEHHEQLVNNVVRGQAEEAHDAAGHGAGGGTHPAAGLGTGIGTRHAAAHAAAEGAPQPTWAPQGRDEAGQANGHGSAEAGGRECQVEAGNYQRAVRQSDRARDEDQAEEEGATEAASGAEGGHEEVQVREHQYGRRGRHH